MLRHFFLFKVSDTLCFRLQVSSLGKEVADLGQVMKRMAHLMETLMSSVPAPSVDCLSHRLQTQCPYLPPSSPPSPPTPSVRLHVDRHAPVTAFLPAHNAPPTQCDVPHGLPRAQTPGSPAGVLGHPQLNSASDPRLVNPSVAASHAFLLPQLAGDFPTTEMELAAPSGQGCTGRLRRTEEMMAPIRALGVLLKLDWRGAITSPPGVCSSPRCWTLQETLSMISSWTDQLGPPPHITAGHLQGCKSDSFCFKGTSIKIQLHENKYRRIRCVSFTFYRNVVLLDGTYGCWFCCGAEGLWVQLTSNPLPSPPPPWGSSREQHAIMEEWGARWREFFLSSRFLLPAGDGVRIEWVVQGRRKHPGWWRLETRRGGGS